MFTVYARDINVHNLCHRNYLYTVYAWGLMYTIYARGLMCTVHDRVVDVNSSCQGGN